MGLEFRVRAAGGAAPGGLQMATDRSQDREFAKQSGLFPRLGGYSNVGSESGKYKTTPSASESAAFEA